MKISIECGIQVSFGIESLEADATLCCYDAKILAVDRDVNTIQLLLFLNHL
jgi:hypothetical protein